MTQPICKKCGQPVWGKYITALGATWHPEHFVCAFCGKSIGTTSFHLHQDAPYHAACYAQQVAPRCAFCNKPLMGEYLIDHWGTQFCKEHKQQYPHCAFCGRLVPPRDQEKRAESIRCSACRSTAIESAVQAKPIFKDVVQWLNRQGLLYNNFPISLELCDRTKLAYYLRDRHSAHSLGATMSTTYIQNGQVVRVEVSGVAVLQGLPDTLFRGVTAHELGHVWLIVQGIQGLSSWAEEGFCELLSYRLYKEMNTPESRYHAEAIERNTDPTYGEGFQRIRALADRMGFQRFIETMRTTKCLPSR